LNKNKTIWAAVQTDLLCFKMKFNIDILNTLLITASLVLAVIFPFELFLIVYAVLGPLHYLTEINWIRDKNYFIKDKKWFQIVVISSLIVSLPMIIGIEFLDINNSSLFGFIKSTLPKYTNGFIFSSLVIAVSFLFIKVKKIQYLLIGIGLLLSFCFKDIEAYNIWIGIFLPTIIHVYLFTLLFMWHGSLKDKSKWAIYNVLYLALVPIIITLISIKIETYDFSPQIKSLIVDNRFHVLNTNISKLLGLSDGTTFFFYEIVDLKIQIMIAFAYTYHYLNWFSKTTVIGWHKNMNISKTVTILIIWIIALLLYFYIYKLGLALLLMMSLMHVFLEFPINLISIKGIYQHYLKRNKKVN
jgi:hypothetical protein